MAFRWRIRHKLMLGLGLVIGVMALLLAGTLYGLASYRGTMRSIDSKLAELEAAGVVKEKTKRIEAAAYGDKVTPDARNLADLIGQARNALKVYETKLEDTLSHGRDPDMGFRENKYVKLIGDDLDILDRAIPKLKEIRLVNASSIDLIDCVPKFKDTIAHLVRAAEQLHQRMYEAEGDRIVDAKKHYQTSLWIVITISVGGVLLLCSLLRFFYGWVFYPIRDLEQGAGRVARGDFDFRIEVDSGDEMEDLAAAFNDMTSRLREMYRDLARQVNERSRQLVRSERLASVGFLAAGVAHEINNPLASIAFCSEALEQRLRERLGRKAGDDDAVVTKYLKMIQDEAFRCKSITQRLLEFSRGGERSREPADLGQIVQSVLDMVEHLETSKGKQVVFQPMRRVVAWVNAPEVKSVVLNLVVNALDSMDEGGTLTITLAARAGMAVLEFADTGCGMAAEVLENIFEPFYTRSRTGKGTGLGLSISHRVISQHGGEIEAVSPGPDRGSTFTVRLPLQPAEPVKEESLGQLAA